MASPAMRSIRWMFRASTLLALAGCTAGGPAATTSEPGGTAGEAPGGPSLSFGKGDTSAEAVFLDFELEGTLLTSSASNVEKQIESQLLYTVGHLNEERSVGRLDTVELADIRRSEEGDLTRIDYRAKMPVAWNKDNPQIDEYTFRLPEDVSFDGLREFTDKYKHDCVSYSAHDVDEGVFWYYYRPGRCELADADVVDVTARATPSDLQSHGQYPEYHKVWEDDALRVVAVFGKNKEGATSNHDAGISAYNDFIRSLQRKLEDYGPATMPEEIPYEPGVDTPDVHIEADLDAHHRVVADVMLVDNVRTAGPDFDHRYEELSRRADLIIYSGHSGLGANIRALASKGDWVEGQYAIVFMNGCDTYAYLDGSLAEAHAAINPDDPNGTKYLDIVANAMPAYAHSSPGATMAVVDGLMSYAYGEPQPYEPILEQIDSAQVVLVAGEQDNEFTPE